jgi:type I restriction enzyme M protein
MLDQKMIGSILKNIANSLWKGGLSPNAYGSYILPLLFLKWLSDVHSNNKFRDKIFDDRINISKNFDWQNINKIDQDIAENLSIIFHEFEELNPLFQGFFSGSNLNKWRLIGDNNLREIIHDISFIDFGNDISSQSELSKKIYDELTVFTESTETRSKANFISFTPYHLRRLAIALISPQIEMQIYDPACGSGSILIEVARYFKEQGKDPHKIKIFGQERNDEMRAMAAIGLLLHGVIHLNILPGSIIESPPIGREGKSQKFDIIITNPPFGIKNWKSQLNKNNDLYQFKYGDPPQGSADYAFIQRVLAALSDKGKAAIIVPHGVLFRGGAEKIIRENIVKDDVIDAVIGLPENLFYATKISTALIIFNKQKSECRKNNILFVDASHDYELKNGQNFLTDDIISKINLAYSNFEKTEGYSQVISCNEISKNDYILAVSHYIKSQKTEIELNINSQVEKVQDLEAKRTNIEVQMNACLMMLGVKI